MHSVIAALRALQELDKDIFKLQAELSRLPEEARQRRAQIDGVIEFRQAKAKSVHELKGRIKEIEDATTMQRQRLRKLEHEAANSRGDMALLAAFQHEIRSLKREISQSEEDGLVLVEEADVAQAEVDRLGTEIEGAEADFVEFNANVESEMAVASGKLETLRSERKRRLSSEIDPESMQLYETMLTARGGVALAELDGRVCQACSMEVPTNLYVRVARSTTLTQCPSCDRILYLRT